MRASELLRVRRRVANVVVVAVVAVVAVAVAVAVVVAVAVLVVAVLPLVQHSSWWVRNSPNHTDAAAAVSSSGRPQPRPGASRSGGSSFVAFVKVGQPQWSDSKGCCG